MKKKVILMTVAVEYEVGKTDMISVYEGEDTDEDCVKLATLFVESHRLDAAVVQPLTDHLIRTIEAQKDGTLSLSHRSRNEDDNEDGLLEDEMQYTDEDRTSSSQKTPVIPTQGHHHRGKEDRRGTSRPEPLSERNFEARGNKNDRGTVKGQNTSKPQQQQTSSRTLGTSFCSAASNAHPSPAASSSRPQRSTSRDPTPVFFQNDSMQRIPSNPNFAHVSSRYKSPTKRQDDPTTTAGSNPNTKKVFTHKPHVCEGTKAIVETQVRNRRSLHERLYADNEGILARRREQSEQRARAASEQRKYNNHQVKGLNWETGSESNNTNKAFGQRLYQQAMRQQQTLAQRQARAQEDRDKKELETMVFQPKINKYVHTSRVIDKHRDPFHLSPQTKTVNRNTLTTEEQEILNHCTFQPQIIGSKPAASSSSVGRESTTTRSLFDSNRSQQPFTTSSSTHRSSPMRQGTISPNRPVTPQRPSTRNTEPPSPLFEELRSKSPTAKKMATNEIQTLTSRLYQEARRKEERLQAARHHHETVDPKTGRPLYRPFVGR